MGRTQTVTDWMDLVEAVASGPAVGVLLIAGSVVAAFSAGAELLRGSRSWRTFGVLCLATTLLTGWLLAMPGAAAALGAGVGAASRAPEEAGPGESPAPAAQAAAPVEPRQEQGASNTATAAPPAPPAAVRTAAPRAETSVAEPPAAAAPRATVYQDERAGFRLRLPPGWTMGRTDQQPWRRADGTGGFAPGVIAVSRAPASKVGRPEDLDAAAIARRLEREEGLMVMGHGQDMVGRYPCLFFYSVAEGSDGGRAAAVQMTYVFSAVGSTWELRAAARPEVFERSEAALTEALRSFEVLETGSGPWVGAGW